MFKLPLDIRSHLKKDFPNVKNIDIIVDRIFELIFQKTIYDGACTIMKFGCFFAYKAYSSRMKKIVPRFKFALSRSMLKNLQDDEMLMSQISNYREPDERMSVVEKMDKTGGKARLAAENRTRGKAREKTQERVVQDEISSILGENFQ